MAYFLCEYREEKERGLFEDIDIDGRIILK
jgi:hypothetical protein